MSARFLTALPVYNEFQSVNSVLDEVALYSDDILVVDDGSIDGTRELLQARPGITVVHHKKNRGYGAALKTAFDYAVEHDYDLIVTIDCDGQHEPQRIRQFVSASDQTGADIVSGSRYLKLFADQSVAPPDRRRINWEITRLLNERLELTLTDAFCGFKAYRVAAIQRLNLTENGYAMPLQLWVQAWCHGLSIVELPIPLIYLDANRSFCEQLDDPNSRLQYYRQVIASSLDSVKRYCPRIQEEHVG
jgi:dolichol-phosphate mannosyltransferase